MPVSLTLHVALVLSTRPSVEVKPATVPLVVARASRMRFRVAKSSFVGFHGGTANVGSLGY